MARANDFELMLIRHGDAEPWGEADDAARQLTGAGRAAIARCVPTYNHFDWGWSTAYASPFVRAAQTANILHQGLAEMFLRTYGEPLPLPKAAPFLTPDSPAEPALRTIIAHGQTLAGPRPRVAAIAHNPILSTMAKLLLFGPGEHTSSLSLGCGDMIHMLIPAPSPFDTALAPVEQEPLPRAILLGLYPRAVLERGA